MTNFLPSGIIKDTATDIYLKVRELKKEEDLSRLQKGLGEIEEMALELALFLEKLSCDPLIYMGAGSTEEVIKRLDWALTFIEDIDPTEFFKYSLQMKKRGSK